MHNRRYLLWVCWSLLWMVYATVANWTADYPLFGHVIMIAVALVHAGTALCWVRRDRQARRSTFATLRALRG